MMKFFASLLASFVCFCFSRSCRWGCCKIAACTLSAALALVLMPAIANAADDVWKGTTSANWSEGTNWSLGSPPGSGDVVRFDNQSTANLNTVNDLTGLSILGIANTSAGANNGPTGPMSITGNAITLGA